MLRVRLRLDLIPSDLGLRYSLATLQLRTKYLEGLQQSKVETRTVWLNLEHERMHLETLAYMRAQARKKAFDCQAAAAANGFHSNGHNSGDYTASSTTGELQLSGRHGAWFAHRK